MFNFIQKLREKPENKRRAITLGISLGVVVIIFAAWVITLVPRFSQQAAHTKEQVATPLSAIKENIDTTYEGIKNGAADLKKSFDGLPEDPSPKSENMLE